MPDDYAKRQAFFAGMSPVMSKSIGFEFIDMSRLLLASDEELLRLPGIGSAKLAELRTRIEMYRAAVKKRTD